MYSEKQQKQKKKKQTKTEDQNDETAANNDCELNYNVFPLFFFSLDFSSLFFFKHPLNLHINFWTFYCC